MNELQWYRAVWHSADVGMCVTDLEGTYLEVNDAYCRIYGYERSELIGANLTMVLPVSARQQVLEQHRAFLLGQNDIGKDEFRTRRKDGTCIDVSVTAARIYDEAGKVLEVTTVTDISERNALLRAERYQRQLSDAQTAVLAQVVSLTDMSTILDTVLEHVNALVPCDASSIALLEKGDSPAHANADTRDVAEVNDIVKVAAWRNNHRQSLETTYQTFRAPLSALALEQTSLHQGAMIVSDVYTDSRLTFDGDRGAWIHSFAAIPLRVKDTVLGWLWLDAEAKHAFDQTTIHALQPFVDAAAIALRNAQLYARSQYELAEKERVQARLARSEAHMRHLLRALPDGFVRHDRAGHYLEVHIPEHFNAIKPAEALLGKTIDEVVPASVAAQMHKHLEQLFTTGQMQKYEYVLEVNGQTHYREVRWVPLSDQEVFGLVRDVSEQKRVEEALKRSEALFRNLFESSSLGIALVDDEPHFVDVNDAFCTLLGYTRQELLGVNPKTITHPDDQAVRLMFADRDEYQLEKRYLNKQGEVIWVLVSATRLRLPERPLIIKHVQDISAQKRLEQALQASQQQLESIVNTLPDVVLTLAADNTITFSNVASDMAVGDITANNITANTLADSKKVADDMTVGYVVDSYMAASAALEQETDHHKDHHEVPPAGVAWLSVRVGQNIRAMLPPEQRPTLLNAFERVRSRGGISQLEVCLPATSTEAPTDNHTDNSNNASAINTSDNTISDNNVSNKHVRWFLVRVRPGEAGSHELVVVMTDISDIKRSTMRLERALSERTTLLKEIHHRVKNNMQVISSLLHLRAQTLASDAQGQIAKASLRDSRERIRAMALVHEVMYETDHFDAIDFHVYLDKLLRMVMRVNRIGDVHLALSLEPVTLHIDQAIPCGLIANELLSNALKHAFDDDQQQREIRVEVRQQEDDVSLYVMDNGVGLPATMPENQLGMTIIESLVTQLEGTLTFTNRQAPERGLIASVRFPNALSKEVA